MSSAKRTTAPTPKAEATTRVALYLRISTDEEHQPFSLEAQEHRLTAFVPTQPGWEQVKTYVDQTSGAYAERPGLSEALRDARLGLYDVLLVYRVDRFARSLKVLVHLLEELDSAGVAFRSATEPIDTSTATGRMLAQLLGVFAEFERATIIDRVVGGMERKAARGEWPGGSRPYGIRLDADERLAREPSEFPVVERIFSRYAVARLGAAAVAGELNADGLRTRAGKPWSAKVVLDVLRNRAYLGEVSFRGTWHRSSAEPLLDPGLFEKAQALLVRRGEGYDRRFADTHPDYLLTGLITCGKCGRRYIGTAATGKRHRYRYYSCWSRQRYGSETCRGERVRADALEAAVFSALGDLYADPSIIGRAIAVRRRQAAVGARQRRDELTATEAELAKTEASVDRYMHAFESGTVTEDMFGERVRELGRKAQALRRRRAELLGEAAADAAPVPSQEDLRELRVQLVDVGENGPGPIRKAVAQAFVQNLVVEARDRVQPTFRIPSGLMGNGGDGDSAKPDVKRGVRAMTPEVGEGGVEPPPGCPDRILNPARLPIPPLARAAR